MKKYKNIYSGVMSKELALFIKETRKGASWRATAIIVSKKYPELDIIPGHQLEGIELCQAAKKYLKEKDWD